MCYASIIGSSLHTARKATKTRCRWCGELVVPGERYQAEVGEFEREFFHSKAHVECLAAEQDWFGLQTETCVTYEQGCMVRGRALSQDDEAHAPTLGLPGTAT